MEIKLIITAKIQTDSLEDDAIYSTEDAVKETLEEYGYDAEIRSRVERN